MGLMILTLMTLSVGIVIQTIFLLAAFWAMIKLQKLEYNFPGLLGSVAFIATLDEVLNLILGRYLGFYLASSISVPIVVCISYFCIAKVTGAELVDVFFTVVVGRALWFGMNLWLIGSLMGELRPSSDADTGALSVADQRKEIAEGEPMSTWTNQPTPSKSTPSPTPGAPVQPAKPVANNATNNAATEIAKHFIIKGVTRNGSMSAVTIQFGNRTYTLFLGDSAIVQTADGPVTVRFKELDDAAVVLVIKGAEAKLPFRAP